MKSKQTVWAVRDQSGRDAWKQLAVIGDESIVWIELVPAYLAGWNVRREWIDGAESWPRMTAAAIVEWKQSSGHPFELATDAECAWALARVAAEVAL